MTSTLWDRTRRGREVLWCFVFVAVLVAPHLPRLRHASLYSDDVQRIADLQAKPLSGLLFRPFNEHMAPVFETVSWIAWQASGRNLTQSPLAFTIASYVPFALGLGLLAWWIRLETGSMTTAMAATALFGLSPVAAETVFWYSASSFTWALDLTIVVLLCARSTGEKPRRLNLVGLMVGAMLAPACSAIGILAGPLGSLRMVVERRDRRASWFVALVPTLGTLVYLAIMAMFEYGRVIRSGVQNPSDFVGGISLAIRASSAWLIPGAFGLHDVDRWLPAGLNLMVTGFGVIAILAWARRSPSRGLIVAALGLILGGYGLTYPFRNSHGTHWLFQVERFHLFPQLGLVVMASLAARPWLSRFDRRPEAILLVATSFAALNLAVHLGRFEVAERMYRSPEQPRTLAALEHLGTLCQSRGVSKAECIAALPPVWSHWFQPAYNGLWMMPDRSPVPASSSDPEIERSLLNGLTATDRKALWGGMDVSRSLRAVEEVDPGTTRSTVVGHLIETDHVQSMPLPLGMGMRQYSMTGWPAHVEFEMTANDAVAGNGSTAARYLCFPCGPSSEPLEVWWSRPGERWSPSRSIRLRPDPSQSPRGWVLPLDRIPHWDSTEALRIRVKFVAAPVAIGEPRLIR